MKKLLSILTLFVFSVSTIPQINFTQTKINKVNNDSDQKKQIKSNTVETVINESLNNNQEDEKKYLIGAFDDINLMNKIQSELESIVHKDNKGFFIYQNDANAVTSLKLSGSNIASFEGLDFFPNLTSLDISDNKQSINLADLQLICRKITVFDISWNKINDIGIIRYFLALKELDGSVMQMGKDFIWDSLFLPLSGITTLTKLVLNNNKNISDISVLSALINLTDLNLGDNSISDISALSTLTNLTDLDLRGNSISDFSVLSNLTNLYYLSLGANSISDVSVLSNLPNLSFLDLRGNSISDVSVLSTLTKLEVLFLTANYISDVSVLSTLTKLEVLLLNWNSISDISALSALINLKLLYLNSNYIPNTDAAWAVLHKLPHYKSDWDNEEVRKSQKIA